MQREPSLSHSAVRSLQSALTGIFPEITGLFGELRGKTRGYSLKPRLRGGERGIRTLDTGVSPYNGLANRRLQPLGHLSGGQENSLPPRRPRFAIGQWSGVPLYFRCSIRPLP